MRKMKQNIQQLNMCYASGKIKTTHCIKKLMKKYAALQKNKENKLKESMTVKGLNENIQKMKMIHQF